MSTIDGIINLDKPTGLTSAKALYRVRAITRMKKSGHTGTLDPGADGVLVLCVGKATKLVERVMDLAKCYRARARLDVTSESFDSDRPHQPVSVARVPDLAEVSAALASFEGTIEQVPPAVSALKVGGVPAYKLTRQGKAPTLAARPVNIYWTHVHAYAWPEIDFEVAVGRGTYVRALIRDLGTRLGCGGCLTALTRTAVGPFQQRDAWSLERMTTAPPEAFILPLAEALPLIEDQRGAIPPKPAA
ncbi:MAG TPA: tRNA pseudouridine(55) synthase TruB [Phycisphaerae bacterium]|nr:tRNA pseudouridine(55) synthase TruB [Phycisphaerales bacterium]HRX83653.1 tRNA pseudouridine(55) synthase TruB [Phycisphaerae bacterium]